MAYQKKVWKDLPSEETPLSADGLNDIENRIEDAFNSIYQQRSTMELVENYSTIGVDGGGSIVIKNKNTDTLTIHGRVQAKADISANVVSFRLPVGFRPKYAQKVVMECNNNVVIASVYSNGNINILQQVKNWEILSFSGVTIDIK